MSNISQNLNSNLSKKSSKSYIISQRKKGRILAFKTLFSYDFDNKDIQSLLDFSWLEEEYSDIALFYARFLIEGTIKNLNMIDNLIKEKSKNWDFHRISYVDRAILRFSIFSLLFEKDLDDKIVIDEAIEIAKSFGTEDSYRFVNGILDAIKKDKRK
ncbi:MAG TPA: transcription antitermination factor NusB [Spirochaetota bacterium]|nr:transcription antitermination factor NusB [Spirochaetota bacterium]HOL56827.1 transcription antitermination factor NusB [Spirochaetota bacterium]HPP04277.1 transcription antitermination factor NusB [Spirochaetota bacterium]